MNRLFISGGQSIGASASASVLPVNIQDRISFRFPCLNSLQTKELKSLLHYHNSKASVLWHSTFLMFQPLHSYMTTGKTFSLIIWTFVGKVISLLFNMLSRFPSKEQVSFNFMAGVTIYSGFGPPKNRISPFPLFPLYLP